MQTNKMIDTYEVRPAAYQTAGDVSAAIKRKLKQLGIDSGILRRVAVASYEAELNMIIHSMGGTMTMQLTPAEITLMIKDIGPGIPDIDKALEEGFSTAGEEARNLGFGAGMGLPNMRRNADGFHIESEMGKGTLIELRFRLVA